MLNQRLTVAKSVANDLFKFETALDDAFAIGSQLSSRLVSARQEARLSAVIGQDALEGLVRTLTMMATARRELIATHHHLKTVADDIGLQTVAFGALVKPPAAMAINEPRLQAVG